MYIKSFFPGYMHTYLNKVLQNYQYSTYPSFNIGMNAPLWGLTYTLLVYSMQMGLC